jgi:hypothetical protein
MKVYESTCNNCLLSPDSIVSPSRRKEIINECTSNQNHFICHKASMKGENVCCKTFYDKLGHYSQGVRIAERLNMIEFVSQPDSEKLVSWKEIQQKNKKS